MSENNNESFEDAQPVVDIRQLEQQLQLSSEDDQENTKLQKCDLWANWCIFIVPGKIREAGKKSQSENDDEEQDDERFVPKTKVGRQIGVMQYIYNEKGKVFINAMLCIDVVLHRIRSFGPQMVGIDRYDDLGVLQWRQELRRFVENYFSLAPAQRRKALSDFDDPASYSPEIFRSVARLQYYLDIPQPKQLAHDKQVRIWPDGLTGRDLELFKLLSGLETMSPRNQALSVLNYILPEDSSAKPETSDSSDSVVSENQSVPIRLETGDKERIARLLKRFPALNKRYPYLLFMIENEIPISKFNVDEGNGEYLYSHILPTSFHFPAILTASSKKAALQNLLSKNAFFKRVIKWSVIIAILCFLIKLAGILLRVWT